VRIMVTGASQGGIGGEICLRLTRDALRRSEPVSVAACATADRPALRAVVDELHELGARAIALTGDLADPEVPARLVADAVEFCGGLDVLASNAGTAKRAPLATVSPEEWDRIMNIDARANWLLAKAAHPALKESRGAIVITGSVSGIMPHLGYGSYPAAKAAVAMLARVLAAQFAADGIRVNVASPGPVRTPINPHYDDPAVLAAREALIPMGRMGETADVAALASFLAGPDSRSITGQNILVDGGMLRYSLRGLYAAPEPA